MCLKWELILSILNIFVFFEGSVTVIVAQSWWNKHFALLYPIMMLSQVAQMYQKSVSYHRHLAPPFWTFLIFEGVHDWYSGPKLVAQTFFALLYPIMMLSRVAQ
jgi:hypothetical protein